MTLNPTAPALAIVLLLLISHSSLAQQALPDRWKIEPSGAIVWNISQEKRLPHSDHIEMSGRDVSVVVYFGADANGFATTNRRVIWPTLRTQPRNVRGYLRQDFGDDSFPRVVLENGSLSAVALAPLTEVRFDGVLTLVHRPEQGLQLTRQISPCTNQFAVIERCELTNVSERAMKLRLVPVGKSERSAGSFVVQVAVEGAGDVELAPGKSVTIGLSFEARRAREPAKIDTAAELAARRQWLKSVESSLRLETPDPVLNRAFAFAKIRAAESVFDTKMGLVHSPGGERYYGGVWANDQCEYSGPFFPFLGDPTANEAALNAYRIFSKEMKPEYGAMPSSFEVEGDVLFRGAKDRGDAAMIAYGASRFALASGDPKTGEELWPHIQWCLEYCKRKLTADGVVASDTDELENRFPAGKANLCTSTLAYGGLRAAAALGRALGKPSDVCAEYDARADALRDAIEKYFGASVEGFETYRYYDGNTVLRAWICLPLTMGIYDRTGGTVKALFSPRLWTDDGLATEAGKETFWDRSTLYALRGVFAAGETGTALKYLQAYSRRRLLGDHVPYAVEAYPEGDQAHLSAESALYCRVITEGLFSIVPTGFRSFNLTAPLPDGWDSMALRGVRAFGGPFDIEVTRAGDKQVKVTVRKQGGVVLERTTGAREPLNVALPN